MPPFAIIGFWPGGAGRAAGCFGAAGSRKGGPAHGPVPRFSGHATRPQNPSRPLREARGLAIAEKSIGGGAR